MASSEFIKKRISGKEKELDKLNKKLERIRKVEAQNWEDPNPYYYNEYDLKRTLRDINDAKAALAKYTDQLKLELEKESSRNVTAIVQFLDGWKARVFNYYKVELDKFFAEKQYVRDLHNKTTFSYYSDEKTEEQIAYETAAEEFNKKCHGYFEMREHIDHWGRKGYSRIKVKNGEYEWLNPYNFESTIEDAVAKLNKDLDKEWNRKYDFIIERTNQIVGQITDASNLTVGAKHDLNGYVIGTRGTAKVQTIGAGGYNIQCYHFRTLINKM